MKKSSKKLKIPMWEIDRNTKIKDYAEQIVEINQDMQELEFELINHKSNIEAYSKRIDIYLTNIFKKPNFKHAEHVIKMLEGNKASIYKRKHIMKNDGIIDDKIKPSFVCQLTKQQVDKIMVNLNDYNEYIDEFDEIIDEYEEAMEIHQQLWDDVKDELRNTKFIRILEKEQNEVEEYDEEKHVLVITQDKKDDWNFKYIRKEDEETFNKFLDSESNDFNGQQ